MFLLYWTLGVVMIAAVRLVLAMNQNIAGEKGSEVRAILSEFAQILRGRAAVMGGSLG